MTTRLVPAGGAMIALLVAVATAAEPVAHSTVPAGDYASFLVTWDHEATPVFRAVIRTPQEYAAVFHPAPGMGNRRPFAPPADFYADALLLVVARVIDAPAAGEKPLAVESLVADGDDLVLRYRFTPPAAKATFTVKEVLLVRVPTRPPAAVRFIENGGPAEELRPADGVWALPAPSAD